MYCYFSDLSKGILSKAFYVVLAGLLAWFWYANRSIPVYVQDLTREEKAVLSMYDVQPKTPWVKSGMSREEIAAAYENTFLEPPEDDGALWVAVSGKGYSLEVPAVYTQKETFVVEGGEDDLGYLPPRTDHSWDYRFGNKNFLISFSIYPELPDRPDRWKNSDFKRWGYDEEYYKELTIGENTVLLLSDSPNHSYVWIKGRDTVWYELSMEFKTEEDDLNEYALEQAYFKHVVHSFAVH